MEYPDQFLQLFPGVEVPEVVGTPCCSQFAVSREKVHDLEQEEYVRLRQWLIETELEPGISGRILEYSWHSMFFVPLRFLFCEGCANIDSDLWETCAVLSGCS